MDSGRWKMAAVALLVLCLPAAALAAAPKGGGHYRGSTGQPKINGFAAPVSFTASHDARKLLRFTYGSLGCQGAGGFQPGVTPYKGDALVHVGTIAVTRKGSFSVRGAKTKETTKGAISVTITTTTHVTGRFTSQRKAKGTIKFTQHFVQPNVTPFDCSSETIPFSAKLR
jgi:hypothetical protein